MTPNSVRDIISFGNHSNSRSTEKLSILAATVIALPEEKIKKIKSFNFDWSEFDGEFLPTLSLEFFS
jgi:hypothetical protein